MNPSRRLIIAAAVSVSALASSVSAFAQTTSGLTRAEVKAQLVAVERNGYNPAEADINYPEKIQAALARTTQSVGGGYSGSHASGAAHAVPVALPDGVDSVYFGN